MVALLQLEDLVHDVRGVALDHGRDGEGSGVVRQVVLRVPAAVDGAVSPALDVPRPSRREAEVSCAAAMDAAKDVDDQRSHLVFLIMAGIVITPLVEGHIAVACGVAEVGVAKAATLATAKNLPVEEFLSVAVGKQVPYILGRATATVVKTA